MVASPSLPRSVIFPVSQGDGRRHAVHRLATPLLLGFWLVTGGALFAEEGSRPDGTIVDANELFKMELDQLFKVEIKSAAGLTKTDIRRAPVAMTEIEAGDVRRSGARSLNALLEISVPNAQLIDHHHHLPHLGFRGIISDREDKYLFQVNGRTMNNRMGTGADNERGIPLLGDVRSVTVVRGPASATHGAGALAGVIAVETYDGLTFQGAEVNLRQGAVDLFSMAEGRCGRKLGDRSGIFIYYGLADQDGASATNAPYYIGYSYPAQNGLPANTAGQPSTVPMANLGAAAFDSLSHKAHASFVRGPFSVWARFVQDGYEDRPMREIYRLPRPDGVPVETWTRGRAFRNRQLTFAATFERELSTHWRLALMQSYDQWRFRELRMGWQVAAPDPRDAGERELFSRAVATWSAGDARSLAFGAELSHESFDDPYFSDALDRDPAVAQRSWSTDTVSFLAEYQWKLDKRWILFLSARADKHSFTDWLLAPRTTLVWLPTDRDTLKVMAGRSVRRSGDSELWAQHVRLGTRPAPESLGSYELAYERKLAAHWTAGTNVFYEDYDAIGWVPVLYESTSVGEFRIAGGELQLSYACARTRLTLSHGVTKLAGASVPATLPAGGQGVTAEVYGYGHDLAESAPFVTKLTVRHDVGHSLTASASVIHYSGFPGAQAMARYAATLPTPPSAVPLSDSSYTAPYGPNLFCNLGMEYRAGERLVVRLDGHNLAALVDEKLSKRNYYFRLSEFSVQPAAVSLALRYRF